MHETSNESSIGHVCLGRRRGERTTSNVLANDWLSISYSHHTGVAFLATSTSSLRNLAISATEALHNKQIFLVSALMHVTIIDCYAMGQTLLSALCFKTSLTLSELRTSTITL